MRGAGLGRDQEFQAHPACRPDADGHLFGFVKSFDRAGGVDQVAKSSASTAFRRRHLELIMTILTKQAILTAQDLKTEDVAVPEWGGEVRVRTLNRHRA